jgi:SAM-dependent methyltransferase
MRRLMSRIAPGGVAVFLVPYETTAAPMVRALRWLRTRLRPVNAAVNLARRRPLDEPFHPTYAYDFSRVMAAIQQETAVSTNALLEPHDGLDTALLFVEAPMAGAPARRRQRGIEVADVIKTTPIEALNQSADEYFAALDGWEHHLAKPFASAEEAPRLLGGLAVLLQGLELAPGARVLEFGAGTGWLSRSLTQLGCHVIALDVSPTALDIARETYARFPAAGEQPPPRFLLFDGRRIELDAGSVDRIVCFHAFHHVPNPDEVIREFARVLAPGGIAGFAEPGPRHSRSSFSQFEMQTYKVVENDVDVHAIWRVAKAAGFADIRLSVFHGPPFSVPLQEFEDFLAGGVTADRWTASTRTVMRSMRTFFLVKEGEPALDSRTAGALRCDIVVSSGAVSARAGEPVQIDVTLTNTGRAVWLPSNVRFGGVRIGAHLYDASGGLLLFDLTTAPLADPPRDVPPGGVVRCRLPLPPQGAGRYIVEIDCVAEGIAWFAPLGSRAVRVTLEVSA